MTMSYGAVPLATTPTTKSACSYTHIVLYSKIFDKGHHFETSSGIQATCRLVEEEYLWCRDELTRDAYTALLATADTLANGRSNYGLGLVLYTKGFEQELYTVQTLLLRYRPAGGGA